jgi:hypothetical protein
MAAKRDVKDWLKPSREWNKKDLVRVRINQTGVETVVCRDYQKRYANEGVIYLGDYDPLDELSYEQLKDRCADADLEFKGNAPKEELKKLLRGT